ncbi:hypothetical protein [Ketobacter alkanivorans]|uniref:hypothetical protein n=1 Tax=Ketobacter alkanivorans TaxID=1917421 RepID=UPI001315150E|nr:hypothetical protein [Ketobacter alkanivorans]
MNEAKKNQESNKDSFEEIAKRLGCDESDEALENIFNNFNIKNQKKEEASFKEKA